MSYLLDALRKAERERNLGRVPDLGFQANETATGAGTSLPAWALAAVGGLIALNLLILLIFWWSSGQREQASAAPPEARAGAAAATPTPAQGVVDPARPAAEKASDTALPRNDQSTRQPRVDGAAQHDDGNSALLDEEPAVAARANAIPEYRALPPKQRAQVPDLRVNGHLYSSIPGRSFVLINGRRYHEGQRLAEGPAVVLIDKAGAIFKYGDIRFRLDAPR